MLSVLIVSFNRREALARTLEHVRACSPHEVIVADNGSADGTPDMLRAEFPWVRLLQMEGNLGVEAFNRAARAASGDVLLILDDDSWPEPEGLAGAMSRLEGDPDLGGVALLPRHPATDASEWPFAASSQRGWPVMGCGNLVRASAWAKVGGYEPRFFLYRNDVDLAMKLLGAGFGVAFNPAWIVRHDSPGAAVKGERWLHLATRNWLWLARRHGRGRHRVIGMTLGPLWSLRQAGWSLARVRCVLRGVREGLLSPAPTLPDEVVPDGAAWRAFMSLHLGRFTSP